MAVTPNSIIAWQGLNASPPVHITTNAQTTVFTPGANGSFCTALSVVLADVSARTLTLSKLLGGTNYILLVTQIALSSGNINGVAPVQLISRALMPFLVVDYDGNPALWLKSGEVLQVTVASINVSADITPQGFDL